MPTPDLDVLRLGEALSDLLPEARGRLEDRERFEVCTGERDPERAAARVVTRVGAVAGLPRAGEISV